MIPTSGNLLVSNPPPPPPSFTESARTHTVAAMSESVTSSMQLQSPTPPTSTLNPPSSVLFSGHMARAPFPPLPAAAAAVANGVSSSSAIPALSYQQRAPMQRQHQQSRAATAAAAEHRGLFDGRPPKYPSPDTTPPVLRQSRHGFANVVAHSSVPASDSVAAVVSLSSSKSPLARNMTLPPPPSEGSDPVGMDVDELPPPTTLAAAAAVATNSHALDHDQQPSESLTQLDQMLHALESTPTSVLESHHSRLCHLVSRLADVSQRATSMAMMSHPSVQLLPPMPVSRKRTRSNTSNQDMDGGVLGDLAASNAATAPLAAVLARAPPNRRGMVWTESEFRTLERAVALHGPRWAKIYALHGPNGVVDRELARFPSHPILCSKAHNHVKKLRDLGLTTEEIGPMAIALERGAPAVMPPSEVTSLDDHFNAASSSAAAAADGGAPAPADADADVPAEAAMEVDEKVDDGKDDAMNVDPPQQPAPEPAAATDNYTTPRATESPFLPHTFPRPASTSSVSSVSVPPPTPPPPRTPAMPTPPVPLQPPQTSQQAANGNGTAAAATADESEVTTTPAATPIVTGTSRSSRRATRANAAAVVSPAMVQPATRHYWTDEELTTLENAVAIYGGQWARIYSLHGPNGTVDQKLRNISSPTALSQKAYKEIQKRKAKGMPDGGWAAWTAGPFDRPVPSAAATAAATAASAAAATAATAAAPTSTAADVETAGETATIEPIVAVPSESSMSALDSLPSNENCPDGENADDEPKSLSNGTSTTTAIVAPSPALTVVTVAAAPAPEATPTSSVSPFIPEGAAAAAARAESRDSLPLPATAVAAASVPVPVAASVSTPAPVAVAVAVPMPATVAVAVPAPAQPPRLPITIRLTGMDRNPDGSISQSLKSPVSLTLRIPDPVALAQPMPLSPPLPLQPKSPPKQQSSEMAMHPNTEPQRSPQQQTPVGSPPRRTSSPTAFLLTSDSPAPPPDVDMPDADDADAALEPTAAAEVVEPPAEEAAAAEPMQETLSVEAESATATTETTAPPASATEEALPAVDMTHEAAKALVAAMPDDAAPFHSFSRAEYAVLLAETSRVGTAWKSIVTAHGSNGRAGRILGRFKTSLQLSQAVHMYVRNELKRNTSIEEIGPLAQVLERNRRVPLLPPSQVVSVAVEVPSTSAAQTAAVPAEDPETLYSDLSDMSDDGLAESDYEPEQTSTTSVSRSTRNGNDNSSSAPPPAKRARASAASSVSSSPVVVVRWTAEETEVLREAVREFGEEYETILSVHGLDGSRDQSLERFTNPAQLANRARYLDRSGQW
ncbi:hypothetical protein BC828DRAFT_397461 [Blastocladiella britannica]|nr:hypothetical protein BC828DRAFT_397461 [Blastocladiella britannica]